MPFWGQRLYLACILVRDTKDDSSKSVKLNFLTPVILRQNMIVVYSAVDVQVVAGDTRWMHPEDYNYFETSISLSKWQLGGDN